MKQSLFVRLMDEPISAPLTLATDVGTRRQAVALAARLAATYPEHGTYSGTGIFWFRDGEGLKEIWAQPVR